MSLRAKQSKPLKFGLPQAYSIRNDTVLVLLAQRCQEGRYAAYGFYQLLFVGQKHNAEVLAVWQVKAAALNHQYLLLRQQIKGEFFVVFNLVNFRI